MAYIDVGNTPLPTDSSGRLVKQTFVDSGQKISAFSQAFISLKQALDSDSIVQILFVSARTLEGVEKQGIQDILNTPLSNYILTAFFTIAKFEELELLHPIQMDASSCHTCLPGTRTDVLTFLTDWLATPSKGQSILWLHSPAGSGKSTISGTIADYYFRSFGRLGAFLFFDANDPFHSDPAAVIHTLAY